jgi:hypothetical protein
MATPPIKGRILVQACLVIDVGERGMRLPRGPLRMAPRRIKGADFLKRHTATAK